MNNWRLLLFALVAVFHPIASFTERHLVDGRHQCCDRYSPAPFGDTRPSIHGTYRVSKTTSTLQRLTDREEIRENRRYELRERGSDSGRFSTERLLVNRDRETRERDSRQGFSIVERSARDEPRSERIASGQRRERSYEKEKFARNVIDLKSEDHTRQGRIFRDLKEQQNRLYRDERRSNRFSNENLYRNFDSQREMQFKPEFQVRQVRDEVSRSDTPGTLDNRRYIARARLTVVQRETLVRANLREEIRDGERRTEQRRSVLVNTRPVERIREMRAHLNSRQENRKMLKRSNLAQDLTMERLGERREINDHRSIRDDERRSEHSRSVLVNNRLVERIRELRTRDSREENREMRQRIEARDISTERSDERREINDQRGIRGDERRSEQRGSSSVNNRLLERMRTRHNSREENREMRQSISLARGLSMERSDERRHVREFREQTINNNNDRRNSYERINRVAREITRATRDEVRANVDPNLFRGTIHIDRRNIRDLRQTPKNIDSRREIRNSDRSMEFRVNREDRLTRERIQIDYRDIHELKESRDERDVDIQRDSRYSVRVSTEERRNPDKTQERTLVARRNIREFRKNSNVNTGSERKVEIQQERRLNERLTKEIRDNIRENTERRISRDEIQRNTRDSRIVNIQTRNIDSRQDSRHNERLLKDNRNEIRENSDRRLARENRQFDRRDSRESQISLSRRERDSENRWESRSNERQTKQNRDLTENERRTETRSRSRDIYELRNDERRIVDWQARSLDRRNIREIRAEPKLSRSVVTASEERNKIENRDRDSVDMRSRNVELARREIRSTMTRKIDTENESTVATWQYVLYTLQGAYLCALFMHMFAPSRTEKPQRSSLRWLPLYNPIKVD